MRIQMNEWVDRWENGWPGWLGDGCTSGQKTEACIVDIRMRGYMGERMDRWLGE